MYKNNPIVDGWTGVHVHKLQSKMINQIVFHSQDKIPTAYSSIIANLADFKIWCMCFSHKVSDSCML